MIATILNITNMLVYKFNKIKNIIGHTLSFANFFFFIFYEFTLYEVVRFTLYEVVRWNGFDLPTCWKKSYIWNACFCFCIETNTVCSAHTIAIRTHTRETLCQIIVI